MIDRRKFLKAASLSGLGLAGGAFAMQHPTSVREFARRAPVAPEKPKVIPIALQLYSVRDDCAADLPGTVAKVADLGYDGVEFAGYYGYSAEDIKRILAVYFEQNVTTEKFEDFDGERWVIFGD